MASCSLSFQNVINYGLAYFSPVLLMCRLISICSISGIFNADIVMLCFLTCFLFSCDTISQYGMDLRYDWDILEVWSVCIVAEGSVQGYSTLTGSHFIEIINFCIQDGRLSTCRPRFFQCIVSFLYRACD